MPTQSWPNDVGPGVVVQSVEPIMAGLFRGTYRAPPSKVTPPPESEVWPY